MLKLNEAPNLVLYALYKEEIKNYARYLKYPLAIPLLPMALLMENTYHVVNTPPTHLTKEEKICLKVFKQAIKNLKVEHGVQDELVIKGQVEKTIELIDKAKELLPYQYNMILDGVLLKINKKNEVHDYEQTKQEAEKLFDVDESRPKHHHHKTHFGFFKQSPKANAVDNETPVFVPARNVAPQ